MYFVCPSYVVFAVFVLASESCTKNAFRLAFIRRFLSRARKMHFVCPSYVEIVRVVHENCIWSVLRTSFSPFWRVSRARKMHFVCPLYVVFESCTKNAFRLSFVRLVGDSDRVVHENCIWSVICTSCVRKLHLVCPRLIRHTPPLKRRQREK